MGKHLCPRAVKTVLPEAGRFEFHAFVRREGSKGGLRITIPAPIARGMRHVGAGAGTWVRVCVQGSSFSAIVRSVNTRQLVVAIPLGIGVTVDASSYFLIEPRLDGSTV